MTGDLHPIQMEAIRKLSLNERFSRGMRFLRAARSFLAAGVKTRNPDWTEEQVRAETQRLINRGRD